MLRKQLTVLGTGCFLAMSVHSALALSNPDRSLLDLNDTNVSATKSQTQYIVQLRGEPASTAKAQSIQPKELSALSSTQKYQANSSASQEYRRQLANKRASVLQSTGVDKVTYAYEHAFNGFSAILTEVQLTKLKSHPDVLNVWPDTLLKLDTANTPAFLELINDSQNGLHDIGTKGEGIIIGIVDSGVWPENPSLDDTGFTPVAQAHPEWPVDACDTGTDPDFACNNKLIGARYFNESFAANATILDGEFDSPRDADGHGTHTMTTAAGNENTPASLLGVEVGTVTGMAPKARVAAYKVCWNGSAPGNSGCFTTDSVAAIDAAVADGVDVINFSISGSRTELTDPVHEAFFNASKAGIFSAISAGNSGPDPQTVAHNVPWVTTVGASTYDGEAALVGNKLEVTYGETEEDVFSIPGSITPAIPNDGFSGELVNTDPILMCDEDPDTFTGNNPILNPEEIAGKVAFISRGSCAFSEKILYAQDAGATGVVVYSTGTPIAMGGDATGITIPGVMISRDDGVRLAAIVTEMTVSINMTTEGLSGSATQIGNQMAGFSSRGESLATADIIKPDITAPGVQILAGTSGSQIDSGTVGESYAFLSGTSMSSPHIAGLAALVKEVNSGWSPATIKSALMTTARQNVTKENGTTPADPFDFGAGHVVPNSAVNPGLVYDITDNDYYAFLCGAGEEAFVNADFFSGACGALDDAGFSLDPTDLNLPSIAIEDLAQTQTTLRIVNNVSSDNDLSPYTATVVMPAGIDVEVETLDFASGWSVSNSMGFREDGLGAYRLTFSKDEDVVLNEWVFGSITWSNGTHSVYSPIAIKPTIPPRVIVPEEVAIETARSTARVTIPAEVAYNGRFFTQSIGMNPSNITGLQVFQDEDRTFAFNEAGLGLSFIDVPEGTRIAQFTLRDQDMPNEGEGLIDLDLYVYRCALNPATGRFSCGTVGTSAAGGSNETVRLIDPNPAFGAEGFYLTFVHGFDLQGEENIIIPQHDWIVSGDRSTTMSSRASSRARDGRTNRVYLGLRGLQSGEDYVGGVLYTDENGDENGMTVIEVEAQ